jgi:hypothetical protein
MAARDCGRSSAAAEHTASVMVLTNGLSSFQHCQYSGTSRCTSEPFEHPRESRRHGISLDRQRNLRRRPITAAQLCNRFSFEQRGLCGQSQQRRTGRRCSTWLFPHYQRLAYPLLEPFDPLADCRGCHVQTSRPRAERAVLDHRRSRQRVNCCSSTTTRRSSLSRCSED